MQTLRKSVWFLTASIEKNRSKNSRIWKGSFEKRPRIC